MSSECPECTTTAVLDGVDLRGRTAIVTGASSGLGVETARALAAAGAAVVAAVRDVDKAGQVLDDAEIVALDLSDLDSVRAAAAGIAARYPRIDMLINNAGVMATPLARTRQGFEMQLGTNHLGHFVFTTALLDNLGAGSRIVNVSSRGHLVSGIRWDDPNFRDESAYDKFVAYGQSKSANVLFTVELERRCSPRGIPAFAVHPGMIITELGRHVSKDDVERWPNRTYTDAEHGAATTVWAATSPALDGLGGSYLEDCAIAKPFTEGVVGGYAPHAVDPEQAARLWDWSLEQTAG
jgi:NAD(P)-dependent dehydrogenase (short-subunit alcohol dehydrogenase family)